jgi:hypothetical protein
MGTEKVKRDGAELITLMDKLYTFVDYQDSFEVIKDEDYDFPLKALCYIDNQPKNSSIRMTMNAGRYVNCQMMNDPYREYVIKDEGLTEEIILRTITAAALDNIGVYSIRNFLYTHAKIQILIINTEPTHFKMVQHNGTLINDTNGIRKAMINTNKVEGRQPVLEEYIFDKHHFIDLTSKKLTKVHHTIYKMGSENPVYDDNMFYIIIRQFNGHFFSLYHPDQRVVFDKCKELMTMDASNVSIITGMGFTD